MSPHTNNKMVVKFTWMQRDPDNPKNSLTELRGNRKGECTTNQLVPPGYEIYPTCKPPTSTRIHFSPERRTKPQPNRYLSKNCDGSCMKDRHPFSILATVEVLNGVMIGSWIQRGKEAETHNYGMSCERGVAMSS